MKKTAIIVTKAATLFLAAALFSVNVFAQPPVAFQPPIGPGNSGSGVFADGSPTVPFDGGLSLLLAASGISYCGRRFRKAPLMA